MSAPAEVRRPGFGRAYSFALVTAAMFVVSWSGQFVFLASTLENWQSEFLQLVWQAAGLSLFLYWGSSQSREQGERLEAKVDRLLRERGVDPDEIADEVNSRL